MKLAVRHYPDIDKATRPRGIFVHALHKSATMFLFEFFKRVAEQGRYRYFSPNLEPPNHDQLGASIDEDFCCCPVRSFDVAPAEYPNMQHITRIFHVRDPRDMLVSEYFSFGWIHPTDGPLQTRQTEIQAMTVDQYVLEQTNFSAAPLETKLAPLLESGLSIASRSTRPAPNETRMLVRYEDLVEHFDSWLRLALPPFQLRREAWNRRRLYRRFAGDFRVSNESFTHKRRVIPGDHRDKLKPATIKVLNTRFAEFLHRFGYD